MSTKSKNLLRIVGLLIFLFSFIPTREAGALVLAAPPPVDMFQLPWDQGIAWVAIDGIDNGSKRPATSSHNYKLGGAIDFAPHNNMVTGENTSNFWVTAAGDGTVIATSTCYITLAHANGWLTQYQFLGNIQVKLGDAVARNQRLGIIADGVRQKYCPGSQEINVPHLHFMLRPSIVGATFAGWEVKYNSLFNITTFSKGLITLGLFKPLLNVLDSQPTATPTAQITNTPQVTATPTFIASPTPTLSGPYVSATVNPSTINVGETALVTISLNNVPAEGYTSAEFTCQFNPGSFEVSNIVPANLFGADAAVAINGPTSNKFILAIAGSSGNKATTSGVVFTYNIKGLQPDQMYIGCEARVSTGNNTLTQIQSARALLTVVGSTPTVDLTPSATPSLTPTFEPPTSMPTSSACGDQAEFISNVTIPTGALLQPGTQFTKTWRVQNIGTCDWTTSYQFVFSSGDQMSAPSATPLSMNVAAGQTVDISINMTAPSTPGTYHGHWMFKNASGALFGTGSGANLPLSVDIVVSTATATPSVTPAPPGNDWLTYTNSTFAFQFLYPNGGQIPPGNTDSHAFIYLPIAPGTNLGHKYVEVIVAENVDNCHSPLATESMLETSEIITINGLTFIKETGQDATAGHMNKWTAYSTQRDNICVSLDFIMRIADPGAFATPPVLVDEAAESAVFSQIVATYTWLGLSSTATPTFTPTLADSPTPTSTSAPIGSATPTFTSTPLETSTPTSTSTPAPGQNGILNGQITSDKPVVINVFDGSNTLVGSTTTAVDGSFSISVPAGTYTVSATADGFLDAQGSVTVTAGNTTTRPTLILLAGDIDGNNVINQFDALTIGMSYNAAFPPAADLNNDGIINVLDLEALAKNYRKTGPVAWQ